MHNPPRICPQGGCRNPILDPYEDYCSQRCIQIVSEEAWRQSQKVQSGYEPKPDLNNEDA